MLYNNTAFADPKTSMAALALLISFFLFSSPGGLESAQLAR